MDLGDTEMREGEHVDRAEFRDTNEAAKKDKLRPATAEPLLLGMDASTVYAGATALTAVTDNAALTYLGSLVEGLSDEFKYALVAGAVTGGGLTVIANAPNPAGFAILRGNFEDESIHPLGLLIAATPPTITAIIAFRML